MGKACRQIEALLDRRAGGLDEADRLRVESHLATCNACRETAALMSFVGAITEQDGLTLSESARSRAIGRALDSVAFPVAERRTWRFLSPTVAAGAIAAAGLLTWGLLSSEAAPQRAGRSTAAIAAHVPAPSHGSVAPGALAPHTNAKGEGTAASEPALAEPTPVPLPEHEPAPGPLSSAARRQFAGDAVSVGGEVASSSRTLSISALAALARAREALAQGDTHAARKWIAEAQAGVLKRRDRAEAETLQAECALLDHDPAGAMRHYLAVATHYPELESGENGLFAAAQLASRGTERESALLERYLKRYPHGRFADEAQARLKSR